MPRKIKQYRNPFLKPKEYKNPRESSKASTLPNLQEAFALHQQGHLGKAEEIYLQLLEIGSRNADVFHLLGVLAHQTGRHQSAIELISQAIEINPNDPIYYFNIGNAHQALTQFEEAVFNYDKAIDLKSDFAEAYLNRGNAFAKCKQFDAAIASYDLAIALKSDLIEVYFNRGNAQQELKQFEEAVKSYDVAINLSPDHVEAYYYQGIALKELKQFNAAVASYDKAITLRPDMAEAYANRGNALQELKQLDSAVASYNKAIALKPDMAEAYYNKGISLQELKQLDAAVASYDKAISLKPDMAEAYSNKGNVLQELKELSEAVACYDKAINFNPEMAEAYYNRGISLNGLKQCDAALVSYEMALTLKPGYEYLLGMRLHARMFLCDWRNFERNLSGLSQKIQNNEKVSPSFPTLALPLSLPMLRKTAEIWTIDNYPENQSLGPILKSSKTHKIRLGYYSADFHNHATTYLIAELFERHDKSKFELVAFSFGPDANDEMRNRVKQTFDHFIDVKTMTDRAVAHKSRDLSIDIAVDLKGLTEDNRLGIFAYKAAPIQVSYLGFPGTLGASYIDYMIADKTIIPAESQKDYSEKIVYLPNSYQVNDRKRAISPKLITKKELGLPSDCFVFCCFNNNFKITPSIFDTWIRILKRVNTSVLWLFEDNPTAAINLQKEAHLRGLDPTRLVFAKRMSLPEHLARNKVADLFLDTLPYNAHTTASDALWAGLPVLTCMGESFASRVAASLLYAIGLPELVTKSQAQYEALAIELATNPDQLKAIKDKLESNRLTTPLFDTALFTKHMEAAYTKMYERYQAGLSPDHIYVN